MMPFRARKKREPLYLTLKAVGSAHNSKIRKAHAYRVSIHIISSTNYWHLSMLVPFELPTFSGFE